MKFKLITILFIHLNISIHACAIEEIHGIKLDGIWAFQTEKLINKFQNDCAFLKFKNDTIYELNLIGDQVKKYSFKINQEDEIWINDTINFIKITGDKNKLIRFWNPEKYGLESYVSLAYLIKLEKTDIGIKSRKLKKTIKKNTWKIIHSEKEIDQVKIFSLAESLKHLNNKSITKKSVAYIHQIENNYVIIYKSKEDNEIDYIIPITKLCKNKIEMVFRSDFTETLIELRRV